jgi:hypothetical protein
LKRTAMFTFFSLPTRSKLVLWVKSFFICWDEFQELHSYLSHPDHVTDGRW